MIQERLQKIISSRGYSSRRKAESLILAGKVVVNGEVIKELGRKVPVDATIIIEGQILRVPTKRILIMFYKPEKCITSLSDPVGRKTVFDYLKAIPERIYPIGRLDYDTSGLLLLTNDGTIAHQIMHPSHAINKVYLIKAKGKFSDGDYQQLLQGVIIDEKYHVKANKIKVLKNDFKTLSYELEMTIQEGRNRQIKKMIKAINGRVIALSRIAIGNLKLDGLKKGQYRHLTPTEVLELKRESRT